MQDRYCLASGHFLAVRSTLLHGFGKSFHFIFVAGVLLRSLVGGELFVVEIIDCDALKVIDVFDNHIALCAGDDAFPVRDASHGRGQDGHLAARVFQRDAFLLVQVLRGISTGSMNLADFKSEEHGGKIQRINAQIQQGSSAQCRLDEALFSADIVAEIGGQHNRLADDFAFQYVTNDSGHRHKPHPHGFRQKDLMAVRDLIKCLSLLRVDGEGFLHQDVFSVLQKQLRILKML